MALISPLYTEIFENFLAEHEQDETWQSIIAKFGSFPAFAYDGLNFDMYDLFKEKYGLREIGCENEGIFVHHVNDTLNEVIIEYVPKIKLYLANYNTVASRKVELSNASENRGYLSPVTNNTKKLDSATEFEGTNEILTAQMKSNAEVLNEAMKVRNVYLEALAAFERCFMEIF